MSKAVHVWEMLELTFEFTKDYDNPYADVQMWVALSGPGFNRRVWGFWDGGRVFRVRVVATASGTWTWRSGSSVDDPGLSGRTGSFEAAAWTDDHLRANPNRRGFVRATPNGHGLQYADGTPFFLAGDTWWTAATWRFPFSGIEPEGTIEPGEGVTFEQAVQYRRRQGFNSISLISCFPNWRADGHPPTVRDTRPYSEHGGTPIRHAWQKNGTETAKDMHDEAGNMPFEFPGRTENFTDVCADYDRIVPAYFQSLDRKMACLSDNGFVPFLETVRRDHGPTWKTYYDWEVSFPRFVNYVAARYGAWNIVFSGVHADWIHHDFSLQREDWNHILSVWLERYGPLPFGQLTTILTPCATDEDFGHGDTAPWLTMHGVGNAIRTHDMHQYVTRIFNLDNSLPCINQEPYYPGWYANNGKGSLEETPFGSDLDNYYARAMMYGSVLSGALAGHVYGTGAYGGDSTGEPDGVYPHIWEALKYESGAHMGHFKAFFESETSSYQELIPSSDTLHTDSHEEYPSDGLDGWAYMARTPSNTLLLCYFERFCRSPRLSELPPGRQYSCTWYNPRTGEWLPAGILTVSGQGIIDLPPFPGGADRNEQDWAAKLCVAGGSQKSEA